MTRMHRKHRQAGRGWRSARWVPVLLLAASAAACNLLDNGLKVTAPDKIETSNLEQPENAAILVNGAVANFECALKDYIIAGGLMSGELMDGTSTAARWDFDKRNIKPESSTYSEGGCGGLGIYTPISTARFTADNALKLLQGWTDDQVPNRTDLIAQAAAYAGYSRILLGEAFCSAAIDTSGELSSAQIFAQAEEKFTTAIDAAKAAKDADMLNLALTGRARARLDQGKTADAAADAALVPAGFVLNATSDVSHGYRENSVVAENNNGHSVSIPPAYRNLTVPTASGDTADPRVVVMALEDTTVDNGTTTIDTVKAGDHKTPVYVQTKYADPTTPMPVASYTEAQLILAEARGGQPAVDIINQLRADAGIPAYTGSNTADAVKALIAQERARWLFLEGQHLYDVRRLGLTPQPAPGTPYSIAYAKGGSYGDQVCFPLPDVERLNNPNIH